jgi:hypothetical protein
VYAPPDFASASTSGDRSDLVVQVNMCLPAHEFGDPSDLSEISKLESLHMAQNPPDSIVKSKRSIRPAVHTLVSPQFTRW